MNQVNRKKRNVFLYGRYECHTIMHPNLVVIPLRPRDTIYFGLTTRIKEHGVEISIRKLLDFPIDNILHLSGKVIAVTLLLVAVKSNLYQLILQLKKFHL